MKADELSARIGDMLETCRDSLASLEDAFKAADDAGDAAGSDAIQRTVVIVAEVVSALRDYLGQERLGRRQPLRLAQRLEAHAARLDDLASVVSKHAVRPTVGEMRALARALLGS